MWWMRFERICYKTVLWLDSDLSQENQDNYFFWQIEYGIFHHQSQLLSQTIHYHSEKQSDQRAPDCIDVTLALVDQKRRAPSR